jgi:hypothetical protein
MLWTLRWVTPPVAAMSTVRQPRSHASTTQSGSTVAASHHEDAAIAKRALNHADAMHSTALWRGETTSQENRISGICSTWYLSGSAPRGKRRTTTVVETT